MGFIRKLTVSAFVAVALVHPDARAATFDAAAAAGGYLQSAYDQQASGVRVGTSAAGPDAAGYTLARGGQVRWNPCQPIPVVVNTDGAPAGALKAVRAAAAQVSKASGLNLVVEGTTDATPSKDYPSSQYGQRSGWAPVLVAWAKPGTGALDDDGRSGAGMPAWVGNSYVSGMVVLNAEHASLYAAGFGPAKANTTSLVAHELGHIVGLSHTEDGDQLMNASMGGAATFAAGDRAGLARAGAGSCQAAPKPSWG